MLRRNFGTFLDRFLSWSLGALGERGRVRRLARMMAAMKETEHGLTLKENEINNAVALDPLSSCGGWNSRLYWGHAIAVVEVLG
jgi:hypothetical protein